MVTRARAACFCAVEDGPLEDSASLSMAPSEAAGDTCYQCLAPLTFIRSLEKPTGASCRKGPQGPWVSIKSPSEVELLQHPRQGHVRLVADLWWQEPTVSPGRLFHPAIERLSVILRWNLSSCQNLFCFYIHQKYVKLRVLVFVLDIKYFLNQKP